MKNKLITVLLLSLFPISGSACSMHKATKYDKTPVGNLSPNNQFRCKIKDSLTALDTKNKSAVEMLMKIKGQKEKAEDNSFKNLSNIIDQYAENTLKKGSINSLALAIYKDGKIYQQYYGEMDKNSNNKPNDNTLYEIASISKAFVGSLTAKAVLEKKITLDDDIRKYIRGNYSNLQFENTPITIKNLLTHTLGFKNKTPKKLKEVNKKTSEGYYENRPFNYNLSDFLEELKTVELNKKPGTFYEYSSVGPELAAYILEQVYHKSYSSILQDFMKELNLKNTYLQDYQKHGKYLSNSYGKDKKLAPLDKNPLLGGAYGMITNLPDLTKFMQFQLESDNPIIKESTRLLFKEEIDDNDKGYLWDVGFGEKEGFYYGKTGTSYGVQSGILVCRDSHYGLVLIMNNNSDDAQKDWSGLYNRIESALIDYPKINLVSLLQNEFMNNFEKAAEKYKKLKKDTANYVAGSTQLNNFGYELLNDKQIEKAIKVFKFAVSEDLKNANLYDSLGEAYFMDGNYESALFNYRKSLQLNPNNENAKKYITEIEQLKLRQ
jgi:CubicO group peptidase (beta-lactamase class C family)